jgi:hypothetical protein
MQNCREGLERFSQRRFAKLLGISRMRAYRIQLMASLPESLTDYIAQELPGQISTRQLAKLAKALQRGENFATDIEVCPHCGGVVRERGAVNSKLVKVFNRWLELQQKNEVPQPPRMGSSEKESGWKSFNPSLPREGRLARQIRRAFTACNNRPLSMRELREWCYAGRARQHWFYINIKRALARLGARQIGRSGGIGRPAVYATCTRHSK